MTGTLDLRLSLTSEYLPPCSTLGNSVHRTYRRIQQSEREEARYVSDAGGRGDRQERAGEECNTTRGRERGSASLDAARGGE